jgi:hypothetical protein
VPVTPIIPVTWDPLRQEVNDFLAAIISAFMTAVPGVVYQQFSEIPEGFTGEVPFVYLGSLIESEHFDAGLRITLFTGEIGYVDSSPDNQQSNTRANSFADYFREVFTVNARILPEGIFQQTGLREERIAQGNLNGFQHLVLDFVYNVQEGRS